MNVIVGVIVDSVNTSRQEIEDEEKDETQIKTKPDVTLESLSLQIQELQKSIEELKREK